MAKNKVALVSLGCPKNLVNSEQMLYLLADAGFELVGEPEEADCVVVNTCGFIESAKSEAIDTILALAELKKTGKLKSIVATGCLVQRYQDEFTKELSEVDCALGTGCPVGGVLRASLLVFENTAAGGRWRRYSSDALSALPAGERALLSFPASGWPGGGLSAARVPQGEHLVLMVADSDVEERTRWLKEVGEITDAAVAGVLFAS